MAPSAPRRHRLPQHRNDFVLVPPPLDLTLPLTSEKSPLPAIIVTPSSPSCSTDFSIAFIADPLADKPSIRERLSSLAGPLQLKARTTFILLLLFFMMACHLLTHRLATRNPHLQFQAIQDVGVDSHEVQTSSDGGWFGWQAFWDIAKPDDKREFVVSEPITT
ncbi:hypothetical protein FA95DRAFT_1559240 [Auriscalpium vulgare]|uniref:Uncharacterized protein n=1 Tax=Auriscalpium vulgare TaxID=40419 RepID=A0ACB8RTC7_9AGAM|nr:hypothetical protein FA95DRAFT_1559240 [Auriscalpium vulgare]